MLEWFLFVNITASQIYNVMEKINTSMALMRRNDDI